VTDLRAVSGTRRAIKELVDGTIRVSVDVDPQYRRAFFELFPDIDTPIALAPLADDFEHPEPGTDSAVVEAAKAAVKGGELAKLSGILCSDPEFQDWMIDRAGMTVLCPEIDREETVAALIREMCGVKSRAELDHNAAAAKIFHDQIRKPWASSGVTR
jgi:hypothetical protein